MVLPSGSFRSRIGVVFPDKKNHSFLTHPCRMDDGEAACQSASALLYEGLYEKSKRFAPFLLKTTNSDMQ